LASFASPTVGTAFAPEGSRYLDSNEPSVLDRHVCSFGYEFAGDVSTKVGIAACDDGSLVGEARGFLVVVAESRWCVVALKYGWAYWETVRLRELSDGD
jgi:hypothetical protein